MSKTSIVVWPYLAMIIVGLVLPSDGNHGITSPKSLTFLMTFFSVGLYFILRQKISRYQLKLIAFAMFTLVFLLIWLFFGLQDRSYENGPIDQFKLFLITTSFTLITLYIVSEGLLSAKQILRVVILSNFIYSLGKVVLVILGLLNLIDLWGLIGKTGVRFMSMGIVGGISRLQTSVDIITPFLIYFVLQSDRLELGFGKKFRMLFCLISILSTILSFSRFLMMVAAASFILYWMTLNLSKMIKGSIVFFSLIILAMALIGFEKVGIAIENRFLSSDNYQSDQTRVEQINALMDQYVKAPFWGTGLGGYALNNIRDSEIKHSYEVQWTAFLMQLGFIGICILMIPLGIISGRFILLPFNRTRWGFFAMFLLWLLSGFTNPFLISLTSGIVYSMFLLAGSLLSRRTLIEGRDFN